MCVRVCVLAQWRINSKPQQMGIYARMYNSVYTKERLSARVNVCALSQNRPRSAANEPQQQYYRANRHGNRRTLPLVNSVVMISELDVSLPPSQSHNIFT